MTERNSIKYETYSDVTLEGPKGQKRKVGNVKAFAKKHKLAEHQIKRMIAGEVKNHKGWTVLIEVKVPMIILKSMMDTYNATQINTQSIG